MPALKFNCIKVLSLAGLLAMAPGTFSRTLSPDEALGRAIGQIRHNAPQKVEGELGLRYTETLPGSENPAVYVFSRPGSYYVVSADDKAEALLGYADNSFDPANIPPSLKWWLGEYARQIEAASENSATPRKALRAQREAIAPMVKTIWDQDAPYNNMCPLFSDGRAVTGCAATAMAQVMKYFNYPEKGKGAKTYVTNGKIITLNFANITFDWQNMLNAYHGVNATEAQTKAVAQLMYACGVSVNMSYSAIQSGATDMVVPNALVNYFNYDKGVRYFMRDYYTIAQWEDLIYNQLATCGPVQYSGQSNEGGHSFVCDGYSSDGYFHINWGWSGMSDGYYLLTALEPDQQGIGGSLSGFDYQQSVVGEVREPVSGSTVYPELYAVSQFNIPATSVGYGGAINVNSQIANYSYTTFKGTLGLKFVNQSSGAVSYAKCASSIQLKQGYLAEGYAVTMPVKGTGKYTVTPAVMTEDGKWYDVPVKKAYANSYTFSIAASKVTITPNNPGTLRAEDLNVKTKIYLTQDFNLTATVRNNNSEGLYATIAPAIISNNTILATGEYMFVSLNAGESTEIDYVGAFTTDNESWTPGGCKFQLCFIDTETKQPISDAIDVTVYNKPANTIVAVSNFTIEGGLNNVDATNIKFTGSVKCRLGYFGGRLDIAIFPNTTDGAYALATYACKPLFLGFAQSGDLDAHGRFTDGEVGKSYIAAVYNGMDQVSNPIVFTVGSNSSGINEVPTDESFTMPSVTDGYIDFGTTAASVNVYSMAGTIVYRATEVDNIDLTDLAAGIYIIEATEKGSGARHIKRIVKR